MMNSNLSKKEKKTILQKMRNEFEPDFEENIQPISEPFLEEPFTLITPVAPEKIEPVIPRRPKLKCPNCLAEVDFLTIDHIIPRWIFSPGKIDMLGLRNYYERDWHYISQRNKKFICSFCNGKKGGRLDFKDPFSRLFIRQLIKKLSEELDKNGPKAISLKVICKCKC